MEEITLLNGRRVFIYEENFPGMAGEPMTILYAAYSNKVKQIPLKQVYPFMKPCDKKLIKTWERRISESNEVNAIN